MSRLVIIGGNSFIAKNFLRNCNYNKNNLEIININTNLSNNFHKYIKFDIKTNWSKYIFKDDTIIFFSSPSHTSIKNKKILIFLKNFSYFLNSISKLDINKLIFISSQKVLGETSEDNNKLFCFSRPNPKTKYSKYKFECENLILENNLKHKLNFIILRPPVVIGHGMKGNINLISKFLKLRIPLPIKFINSNRNYISVDNLSLIINKCISSDKLNNYTYTLNDGYKYSLSEIVLNISSSIGVPVIIFNNIIYYNIIFLQSKLLKINDKIFKSFYIDCSKDLSKINVSLKDDLQETLYNSFKDK